MPGAVRAAVVMNRIVGGLSLLGGLALAATIALVNRFEPALAERLTPPALLAVGVVSLGVGAALVGCAGGLRRGARGPHRASIGLHLVAAAPAMASPRQGIVSLVIAAVALATLLAPTTRRWVRLTPSARAAIAEEERQVRRARRRLTPEAPSLAAIRLLPDGDAGEERHPHRR